MLWLHSKFHHQEREDVGYSMRVTGVYSTPLDRQIMERIHISNFKGPVLLNRKNELGGSELRELSTGGGAAFRGDELTQWIHSSLSSGVFVINRGLLGNQSQCLTRSRVA